MTRKISVELLNILILDMQSRENHYQKRVYENVNKLNVEKQAPTSLRIKWSENVSYYQIKADEYTKARQFLESLKDTELVEVVL